MATRARHIVRWGGIVLAVILVLLGAAAGGLYYLVSRLDVRAEISNAVEHATGRKLTIAGSVGVSFWPVLGLEAHEASLANVQGGRAPALAAMDAIHVGVDILPLFHREVVVKQLVLDHPRIALEVDSNGVPNWTLQPPPPPAPAPGAPAPKPTQAQSSAPPVQAQSFSLRDITINDGEVSFFDARRNGGWNVTQAKLHTALTSLTDPFVVDGSLTYGGQSLTLHAEIITPQSALKGQGTPLRLEVQSQLLNAEFTGRTTSVAGEMAGEVRAWGPSLRQLAFWAGAPIVGGVGLENYAVSGSVGVSGGQYSFSNAGFSVDQVRGRGDFVLMRRNNKPYVSGRLEIFDFDFNPYLTGVAPPQAAQVSTDGAPAGTPGQAPAQIVTVAAAPRAVDITQAPTETPIDFSPLKSINADLELTTHKVLFQHLLIDHSSLDLVVNDGFFAATLHEIDFYGGSAIGSLQVDARDPDIKIGQQITLHGVDANKLLSDAVNFQNLEGTAEVTYTLHSHGRTQSDMIKSTDGTAHIEVVSGAIRGVDMGGLSRTLQNALNGDLIKPAARTQFEGMSATFAIGDGVLASSNLSFNTKDLAIPGIGVIDLPGKRIDLRMAPRSSHGGIVIPFSARGPFTAVQYTTDITDRARREIQARITQVQAASH
ncbi:MAG: AsmA family protein [Alphaproteobacteria bacterium]